MTNESVSDVLDTATEVTGDAAQDVNQFFQLIQDNIPNIVGFGIRVLLALLFFFIGSKLIKWFRKVVRRSFEHTNVDAGVIQFVDSMLKFGLYVLLIFMIASNFGIESSSIAALIASAGVAIGLAVQGSLSNFAGGVLILLIKPFRVGDYIIYVNDNLEGTVSEIQMFYTILLTVDNRRVVIPNGVLSNNSLINVTAQDKRRLDIDVGIGYASDLKLARDLCVKLMDENEKILKNEEHIAVVDSLADSAVMLKMRFWVRPGDYWTTKWQMTEDVKLLFDANGIEIPFNQMDVNIRK